MGKINRSVLFRANLYRQGIIKRVLERTFEDNEINRRELTPS